MKTNKIQEFHIKPCLISFLLLIAFDVKSSQHDIKQSSPQNSHQLSSITKQITLQTGVQFVFNASVQQDSVSTDLRLDWKSNWKSDWKFLIKQVLAGYNYTLSEEFYENQIVKKVHITGYAKGVPPKHLQSDLQGDNNGNAIENIDSHVDADNIDIANNVIGDIDMPIDQLIELPEGADMTIDLPIGAFNFKQENAVFSEDGTSSWVGTLEGNNNIYRMYLAKTQDGDVVGNVYTPEGAYNIETINGQTVLFEIDQVGMR